MDSQRGMAPRPRAGSTPANVPASRVANKIEGLESRAESVAQCQAHSATRARASSHTAEVDVYVTEFFTWAGAALGAAAAAAAFYYARGEVRGARLQ